MERECDFCLKEQVHGGDCRGKWDGKPCLLFERDPRGRWIREDTWFHLKLGGPIPKPKEEIEATFIMGNVDKKIKVYAINNARWKNDNKGGLSGILIGLSVGYWSDEGGIIHGKPKLRLIKTADKD